MKQNKRPITEEEFDALLSGSPILPADTFAERTLLKASPVTFEELDFLLTAKLARISPDFTERTLAKLNSHPRSAILKFPTMRWLIRSGMAAAVIVAGLFSYSVWQSQNPLVGSSEVAQADIATMGFEELLYLEETLSSAKVLIELEKTVPLYYLIDETDS